MSAPTGHNTQEWLEYIGNNTSAEGSLPTGAATAAKQDTGNTSLSNIDTKVATQTTLAAVLALLAAGIPLDATTLAALETIQIGNWPGTQPISAASLPLPSGASTAAKQPALGIAGTPSADVQSMQGVANGTPVAVGGQKTPITVAFTRPADTTAYTAKDAVAPVSLTATAATNATPIVMTTGTHGLVDGDAVTISGVVGNTAANGNFWVKVTGYSSTTFALYSDKALTTAPAGNGAYTSGGTVIKLLRFTGAARVNGGSGYIVKATILTDQTTNTEAFRLHLFHTPPTALADNVACTAPLYADASKYTGTIDFVAAKTEGSGATAAYSNMTPNTASSNLPLAFVCSSTNMDLYGILESPTGFTPASGQQVTLKLTNDQD